MAALEKKILSDSKRIVIKVGSALISSNDNYYIYFQIIYYIYVTIDYFSLDYYYIFHDYFKFFKNHIF